MFLNDYRINVLKKSNSIAIDDTYTKLTYQELDMFSNNLAVELNIKYGIKPGCIVAVSEKRCSNILICIIAIWKLHAVYLPIDNSIPCNRIRTIVNDSECSVLITDNEKLELPVPIVLFEHIQEYNTPKYEDKIKLYDNKPNELAYIIYTSGSTGKPKGVMIEHKGMYNHLMAKKELLGADENIRIAQNANIGFDISIWQFVLPVIIGSTCYIINDKIIFNLRKLVNYLNEEKITVIEMVPTYLSLLLQYIEDKKLILSSLKYLIITGEEFKANLANKCLELLDDVKIVNAYGPTEASDDVTHYILDKTIKYKKVPIGYSILGINIYIVDNDMNILPPNSIGEIAISGIGVGKGYINRPEETQKSFKNDVSGLDKIYITGDIGMITTDGLCYYYGRKNNQVKINGYRIELEEIENVILSIPIIREVIVCVQNPNDKHIKTLVAHVVLKSQNNVPNIVNYILNELEKQLPLYMIPDVINICNELPKNSNGKYDRNAISNLKILR